MRVLFVEKQIDCHASYQIYGKERRGNQRPVDTIIDEGNWVRQNWRLHYVVSIDDPFIILSWEAGLPPGQSLRAPTLLRAACGVRRSALAL